MTAILGLSANGIALPYRRDVKPGLAAANMTDKKIAARRPLSSFIARDDQGLCGLSPPPFVAARMPRMTAMTATNGMMKPPRSSLASLVEAPLRAATESGAAEVCARTGVLAMETASAAATDAFLKLILNSLLSCSASA